ncbi:MAG TPA: 4-hydroxy-tetrahydrodipicolinate synthase [Chlamydiales bacterium]|nr:4-hydroxy-tetrahydrodipicolinate synthase [Chlamydiales bacterium]
MSTALQAQGSFIALVTPFDNQGRIDWKCVEKLIAWHIKQGTDALVCFGSTGEVMSLSEFEKKKLIAVAVEIANNQIPIIANTGTADTRQTVRSTGQMMKLGAAGCLAVPPYYNKPTQQGCILHFSEIAKVGLPVIIYNNPGRTSTNLEAETVAKISEIPGIFGYKDATGNLHLMRKIQKLSSIPIFLGDDHLTYAALLEGAKGGISVVGNLFPKEWKKMISLSLQGNWEASKKIADRFLPLCQSLSLEPNPQCIKFAMSYLELCGPTLRLPLIPPTDQTQHQIKQVINVTLQSEKA